MPTKKEVRHLALTVLLLEKIRVWSIGETKTDPRIMMINLQQDLSRLYPRDQDTYTNDYIRVLEGTRFAYTKDKFDRMFSPDQRKEMKVLANQNVKLRSIPILLGIACSVSTDSDLVHMVDEFVFPVDAESEVEDEDPEEDLEEGLVGFESEEEDVLPNKLIDHHRTCLFQFFNTKLGKSYSGEICKDCNLNLSSNYKHCNTCEMFSSYCRLCDLIDCRCGRCSDRVAFASANTKLEVIKRNLLESSSRQHEWDGDNGKDEGWTTKAHIQNNKRKHTTVKNIGDEKQQQLESKEYYDAKTTYNNYREQNKVSLAGENPGNTRQLTPEEIAIFDFMCGNKNYKSKNVIKDDAQQTIKTPKPVWRQRLSELNTSKLNGMSNAKIKKIIKFAKEHCSGMLREGWESEMYIFDDTARGREKRCILALLYIKATNGASDAITVPHFKALAKKMNDREDPLYNITLQKLVDPLYVASLIRRCSKWIKNSVFIANLCKYLIENKGGTFDHDFEFWVSLFEFGPKSTALFMWAAFNKRKWLAADSHVFHSMLAIDWTNSTTPEELAWSSMYTVDEQFAITLNDALGSIGQYTGITATTVKAGQAKYDKFDTLIKLAGNDNDVTDILKKLQKYLSFRKVFASATL
jgi:endonuclease III